MAEQNLKPLQDSLRELQAQTERVLEILKDESKSEVFKIASARPLVTAVWDAEVAMAALIQTAPDG